MTGSGTDVGGLIGWNNGAVSKSYSTSSVTGDSQVGGLVGQHSGAGSVSNSYTTGSVAGNNDVGGLVGQNYGSVNNSYATSSVTGSSSVGGLIGVNQNTGSVSGSYWDTESTGQSSGIGGGSGSVTNVNGLTTSEMTGIAAKTNMSAFDWTNIWATQSGEYPTLQD